MVQQIYSMFLGHLEISKYLWQKSPKLFTFLAQSGYFKNPRNPQIVANTYCLASAGSSCRGRQSRHASWPLWPTFSSSPRTRGRQTGGRCRRGPAWGPWPPWAPPGTGETCSWPAPRSFRCQARSPRSVSQEPKS